MQKKEQEIKDRKNVLEIIKNGKFTSISMNRNQEPYIVTLNYGFDVEKNALYFHGARKGLKLEFITNNPKICGTIIEDNGYKKGECSHAYRSVVYWGNMKIIEDLEEKKHAFEVLIDHLEENPLKTKKKFLKNPNIYNTTNLFRIDIENISGKELK